ncbi:MAG: CHASE domain-containing protein [Myxococcaceae bacterium]|nr:CHASE domain-containing protein [Myxococcaceae bacterium]
MRDRIHGHLDADITLLRGAAGFFTASELVTAEEFRLYVERLDLERYDPGVQGLGFSQRIPASQKEAWSERIRANGVPSFRIWPEEPREEYHAIIYLQPQDARNRELLGYDMFTEPIRREAMERAWLSGEPSLSGKLGLHDGPAQAGFLLYVPVYQGSALPLTEAERRQRLEGFVYSAFRARELFEGIFPHASQLQVSLRVYDGMEARPEQLLYDSASPEEERPQAPRFTSTLPLEVAERPWALVFTSSRAFERTLLTPWVPVIGMMGLLLSLLMFAIARSQLSARQRAEASEAERARFLAREQEAHAEAEAQRTYLRELFMQAPALIFILRGRQLVFEFTNSAFQELMGHRELLGRPILEALPDLSPDIVAMLDSAFVSERPQFGREVLIPIAYATGHVEERVWNFVCQPRRNPEGKVDGVMLFAFEVTEQVRARQEAEVLAQELRQAVQARDEFLSVASHELKTPLTPLSLKLQTLAREAAAQPDSPFALKVRAHVEAGRKQLKRLSDLIGDLLDVSRISSGQMKLYWEPVDFAAVVREVAARLEPEAAKAQSLLTVEVPEAVPGSSDRMRLEQIVENLLTNAIKYGAGKPIQVRLEARSERVTLTVKDQGIGIAPEDQARIFERFERAVSGRNYGGLGLGLYITRTIVEALGGTLRVQSQLDQGACFTVELPRERSAP